MLHYCNETLNAVRHGERIEVKQRIFGVDERRQAQPCGNLPMQFLKLGPRYSSDTVS
jgi:hypothetical protein